MELTKDNIYQSIKETKSAFRNYGNWTIDIEKIVKPVNLFELMENEKKQEVINNVNSYMQKLFSVGYFNQKQA